ncbi:hypothetical protein AAMO2058_001401800 [Amorphochlora amoebiformis]
MRIAHGWFLKPFRRGISIFSAGRGYSALNSARVAPCVVLARKGLLGKKGGEGIGRCVGLRFFGKKKKGKKSKGETVEAEQPKKSSKSSKPSPSDDAESELDLDSYKEEMDLVVESLQETLQKFRAGRATPEQIQDLKVRAYGKQTPLKAISQISTRDAYTLVIIPHDPTLIKDMEDGIRNSGEVDADVRIEGNRIGVIYPKPTTESRKDLVKTLKKESEKSKTEIRKIRQSALDALKKDQSLNKDEGFEMKGEIQTITDDATKAIDGHVDEKSKDIMSV